MPIKKNLIQTSPILPHVVSDELFACDCNRQIVLKREYTYQRTTPVKGPDGRETHQTMRLRTAHDETHLM